MKRKTKPTKKPRCVWLCASKDWKECGNIATHEEHGRSFNKLCFKHAFMYAEAGYGLFKRIR